MTVLHKTKKNSIDIKKMFEENEKRYISCEDEIKNIIKNNPSVPVKKILGIIRSEARAGLDITGYYIATTGFTFTVIAILVSVGQRPVGWSTLHIMILVAISSIFCLFRIKAYRERYHPCIIEICDRLEKELYM